jgi:hypothetical protein
MLRDLIEESEFLSRLFPDDSSLFKTVEIHEVTLHRDGPRFSLVFDLTTFPTTPPAKWLEAGCNRVQVTLMATGIGALSLNGWSSSIIGQLSIEASMDDPRARAITVTANTVSIEGVFEHVRVAGVTAYRTDSRVPNAVTR